MLQSLNDDSELLIELCDLSQASLKLGVLSHGDNFCLQRVIDKDANVVDCGLWTVQEVLVDAYSILELNRWKKM